MILNHMLSDILLGILLMLCKTAHLHGSELMPSSPVKICEENVLECKYGASTTPTTTSTITTRTSVLKMKESATTIVFTTHPGTISTTEKSRLTTLIKSSSAFVTERPEGIAENKAHTESQHEEVVNSIIVQKDNLVKQIISTGELICSFEEEIHSVGSNPVCDKPQWKISANSAFVLGSNDYNNPKRYKRDVIMGQRAPLTAEELEKLRGLYSNQQFDLEAAERVKAMGMSENERNWNNNNNHGDDDDYYNYPPEPYKKEEQNPYQSSQKLSSSQQQPNVLAFKKEFYRRNNNRRRRGGKEELQYNEKLLNTNDDDDSDTQNLNNVINDNSKNRASKSKPSELKFLLKSLLEKLEDEPEEESGKVVEPIEEVDAEEECSLYGTWLSPKVGVAIHLRPVGEMISATLENLPFVDVQKQLVDSSWVGSVMISPVSPTTVTLLFQEGQPANRHPVGVEDSPETAVFVGQCVYCKGGNSIQGTWVLFSKKERECLPGLTTTTKNESQVNPSTFERLHRRSFG